MITQATTIAAVLLALSLAATGLRGRVWAPGLVYGASAILSLGLLWAGLATLLAGGAATGLRLPVGLPWLGAHLRLDRLSGVFLVLLGMGGAAISLYAIGYGRHEREPHRVLPFYPGFLGAMALVVLADDAFTFLVSWEVMSLLSWALVLTDHRAEATRRASHLYLVMAGGGTMALLLAFGLMAGAGGTYAFAGLRAADPGAGVGAAVIVLMLLGAGSKAGIYPLHVWLPDAMEGPTPVSAPAEGRW